MAFPTQQGLFQFVDIDHYAILGVPIGAELKEIRQQYLKIARRLHPDTCKATTKAEKDRANRLLTRIINPSWEYLSREQSRLDFNALLLQIGKGLAQDQDKINLTGEKAQQLLKTKKNVDLEYRSLVKALANEQYATLEDIYRKIGQLSELNLVYLVLAPTPKPVLNQLHPIQAQTPIQVSMPTPPPPSPQKPPEDPKSSQGDKTSVAPYLRRAQDYIQKENYAQAVLELRDAVKIEPNNGVCHALLGLSYLKQNQTSMAKVHINNALKFSPQDATVLAAKEELDKILNPKSKDPKGKPDSSKQTKGSFWGDLFGGGDKKK